MCTHIQIVESSNYTYVKICMLLCNVKLLEKKPQIKKEEKMYKKR